MAFMFEKLEVYQKSVDFADEVASLTEAFPRGYGFLVDQLNRAALSIATNLAEGNGRFTKPDRRNFFTIARGSAQECVPLLEIARRRGLVQDPAVDCSQGAARSHRQNDQRLDQWTRQARRLIQSLRHHAVATRPEPPSWTCPIQWTNPAARPRKLSASLFHSPRHARVYY